MNTKSNESQISTLIGMANKSCEEKGRHALAAKQAENNKSPNKEADLKQKAEQEAAELKQKAEKEAAEIKQKAEQEAAEKEAAVLKKKAEKSGKRRNVYFSKKSLTNLSSIEEKDEVGMSSAVQAALHLFANASDKKREQTYRELKIKCKSDE